MTVPVFKTDSTLGAAIRSPIVNSDGTMTWTYLKVQMDWDTRITNGLNTLGQLIGTIDAATVVGGRTEGIGVTLQHLTNTGELDSTDSIAVDGTGHPLAGGRAAYLALVTSGPSAGQVLEWNGSAWVPTTLAAGVSSLNALTGALAITAGAGVTVTPSGSSIQIAAAGGGAGYVKGAITTGAIGGAGTFTASGTVTGATVGSVVSVGVVNSTEGALLSNLLGWVTSLNNVTIQYTASGASLSLNLPVVVFN